MTAKILKILKFGKAHYMMWLKMEGRPTIYPVRIDQETYNYLKTQNVPYEERAK